MSEQRPDPDRLLAQLRADATHQRYGRLKVFFGASAGVGKTFAMLEAARDRQAEGIDVLAGYVETHGRNETAALLSGLELLPRVRLDYRGTALEEFDLDAALARRPQLILVDELAHTNVPGARHPKRWQDVEELLAAGIDVYTTVNVQHLESLNDVVASITGVTVRETVPDVVLERADEIELIDLPPDDLLQRLREGKVYQAQQAARASQGFFRKGNLIALRELALRRTAERVDAQMQRYRHDHAITKPWRGAERILVGVTPGPAAVRLVRAARRLADALHAQMLVAAVETPGRPFSDAEREQIVQALRLAEQLGAETQLLNGPSVGEELLRLAQARNMTKLVVGKPSRPRWQERLSGSLVDELVRDNATVDVYVISGDAEEPVPAAVPPPPHPIDWSGYRWGLAVVACCTGLAALMFPYFAEANIIMAYLIGVVAVAARYGRGPSVLVSVLGVLAYDICFVHPRFSLAVSDAEYLITFAVMLLVGLLISTLTARLRTQATMSRLHAQRTAALYAMTRDLVSLRGIDSLLSVAVRNISATFDSRVVLLLPSGRGQLQAWGSTAGWWSAGVSAEMVYAPAPSEQGVAQWVADHGQPAGLGTNTLAGSQALYLPLKAARGVVGVLGLRPTQPRRLLDPEQQHLLDAFANQTGLAFERALLAEEAQRAQVKVETEQLRNALLNSVSHDLRTPLATITGATSSLLADDQLDAAARRELVGVAHQEAERMSRLVNNLLEMTRIESGGVRVQKEWQPIEEVVGVALNRLDQPLQGRVVETDLPPDLPLVPLDGVLIEQVLVNLLENALKYTPPDTPISIAARQDGGTVEVQVADRGPGLAAGEEQRVFEKFHRSPGSPSNSSGAGLGLTICKAIVEAHGGQIRAENRPDGGAIFRFTLPLDGPPPALA